MNKIKSSADLDELQGFFASVITRPLNENEINKDGIRSKTIQEDVEVLILPNKDLNPVERIQIYNQQYWYRLISIMQEEYPALRHILKIDVFNELVISFLQKHPSEFYSLNHLSDHFPSFLREFYKENDRNKILDLVDFEYAYIRAFDLKNEDVLIPSELTAEEQANLERKPIRLQNTVALFEHDYDFLSYRDEVYHDDDEEIFPTLVRKRNFNCVYRRHNSVLDEILSESEFILLSQFKEDISIATALENVQEKLSEEDFTKIQSWFQKWVDLGLFATIKT